jgi:fused signal recognition particle receptor
MFSFGKKQKTNSDKDKPSPDQQGQPVDTTEGSTIEGLNKSTALENPATEGAEIGFFSRIKSGLGRTRDKFGAGIGSLVLGEKTIDANLLDDIETQLLIADLGLEATDQVIENLRKKLNRKQLSDPEQFMSALRQELMQILQPCDRPLQTEGTAKPFVILMVGVNGVGKTTSIGKLAKQFQNQGKKVMLAAGDTFRAAAVEQLQVWGDRNNVPVVAQATGSDSASVIFDAYQSAKAKQFDVLIADTAGRLHTKDNLMNELEKIVRVLKKQDERLPDEILLVLDATTGQNALSQAESFHRATTLSGVALTKLDGTAKGGVVFAIAKRLGLPIRFIGIGEQIDDLRPFNAQQFVDALFTE